jgi:prepilin peptidase CpaA
MSWTALSWTLTAAAMALLIWAALHDLAARTVPNLLSAGVMGAGLGLRVIDHSLLASLGVAALCFLLLFAVWLAGMIGGGDVKLWSAAVLLMPPRWQIELLFFYRFC